MSKVEALSPEGVKRVSNNVAKASQKEIGGKAMTNFKAIITDIKELAKEFGGRNLRDFDARMVEIKELANTNPELALKKADVNRSNLEVERFFTGVKSILMLGAGVGLSGTAPVVAAGLAAGSFLYGAVKLCKIGSKDFVADRTFYGLNHFVHGRINKDQMNEWLGIDTKETEQSVNTSSEKVKAKPKNNNNGNPADKALKVLKRNNQFLKKQNTH